MEQFHIHSKSWMDTDIPATVQTARRCGVPDEQDDAPSPRFFLGLAWALGLSAIVWGTIILWASA